MKKRLQTAFSTRQHMLSKDFEIYYYSDRSLSKVDLHTHDYYEFYFFLEGDVSLRAGNTCYPICPGDIMLIPPGLPHQPVIHSQDRPYRRFVFWISQKLCNDLLQLSPDYVYLMQQVQIGTNYLFHTDRITFNGIQARILNLIEEMQADHFGKAARISLYVNDLILHLNRVVYESGHPRAKKESLSLYQSLILYIEEHPDADLSLEALSRRFYVSKYHIAHIFKENLGLSIHQYITKKRLSFSREAILGGMGITQAYQSFGFGDYSSFYRAFKKEYGISPKDFRDMQPPEHSGQ